MGDVAEADLAFQEGPFEQSDIRGPTGNRLHGFATRDIVGAPDVFGDVEADWHAGADDEHLCARRFVIAPLAEQGRHECPSDHAGKQREQRKPG